mgnify:CR=1 FL=1
MKISLGLWVALAVPTLAAAQAPAAVPPASAQQPATSAWRAGWLSDRAPLRIGDLITIVVDEQTAASEQVSRVATGSRSQKGTIGADIDPAIRLGPIKGFSLGHDADSRDVGEARHQGGLTAVLTVRVTAVEPSGIATIDGSKRVMVDGRTQEVALKGLVRAEDVGPGNVVLSSRVAGAIVTYKGKKMAPRNGIVGGILSILWP